MVYYFSLIFNIIKHHNRKILTEILNSNHISGAIHEEVPFIIYVDLPYEQNLIVGEKIKF
jgi:hypothetical protein